MTTLRCGVICAQIAEERPTFESLQWRLEDLFIEPEEKQANPAIIEREDAMRP